MKSDIFTGSSQLEGAKHENNSIPSALAREEISNQHKLETYELNISKILITNTRTELTSNRNKLEQHLKLFKTRFIQQNQWPLAKDFPNASHISSLFDKHPCETYLYGNSLVGKIDSILSEPQSTHEALQTLQQI